MSYVCIVAIAKKNSIYGMCKSSTIAIHSSSRKLLYGVEGELARARGRLFCFITFIVQYSLARCNVAARIINKVLCKL